MVTEFIKIFLGLEIVSGGSVTIRPLDMATSWRHFYYILHWYTNKHILHDHIKVKVKVSLSMQWRRIGRLKVQLHLFLTSTLDGGDLLSSHPGHFSSLWENPGTQWIVGWLGSSASLDILEKTKISCSWWDWNSWSSRFMKHFVFYQVPYVSECKTTLLLRWFANNNKAHLPR